MNLSQQFLTSRKALLAAAVAAVFAAGAQAQQDVTRENANRPANESAQIARGDVGTQSLDQHLQTKTLRASKLIGMELQNRNGENLAEVRDIARGSAPGQEMQLIVALEGALGADQKLVALPFDEVQINADGDELYTNRGRDQLASMPGVTLDQPGAAGQSRIGDDRSDAGAADNRNAGAAAGAPSLAGRRIGDLVGAEVVGANDDGVGEIEDIVLSTAGSDGVRAVLQVGGLAGIGEKRIALPLSQIDVERSGDDVTARVTHDLEALERMPEFEFEEDTAAL